MVSDDPSRRDVLRTGAALSSLAAIGSLAGCSSLLDSEQTGGEQLQRVPEDADAAARVDIETVLDDEGTQRVMNAMLSIRAEQGWYSGPSDLEGLLSDFEDNMGLDPDGITTLTPFCAWSDGDDYRTVDEEFNGTLFSADWSVTDVVDALEQGATSYEEDDYAEMSVYEPDNEYASWVGVVSEGEYVIGTEDAVKDTIDVVAEAEDTLDSALQSAYGNTRSGPVRFVSTVPADQLPEKAGPRNQVDLGILDDIDLVAGAVYRNGDNRGTKVTFTAEDEDAADDAAAMLDGLFTVASDQSQHDTVADELDEVEVSQDGTSVVVTYEGSISDLVDVVEETMNTSGGGGGGGTTRAPQAVFSFDYEETKGDRGTLTITHEGGDNIKRSELYVRGEGFAAVPTVDMTSGGQWAGTTNGTDGGEPTVVAGDRVTLGVASDYDISVIWQSESGDTSATLAVNEGPAA